MSRRAHLEVLRTPAAAAGTEWFALARERNPYYDGPPSDHFDGSRFFNPGFHSPRSAWRVWRALLLGERAPWPDEFKSPFRDRPPARVEGKALRVSLIGHASLLIQTRGLNILADPVWSKRASPVAFMGPRRANAPGIAFDDLPKIDVVLVTHNHYDHLDVAALSRLAARDKPRVVTSLGNDKIMHAHDPAIGARAHDWGDRVALSDAVTLCVEPVLHWSARGITDRHMALWCAFVLETPDGAIYHVGDTGYGDGSQFRRVRERLAVRLSLLPIGAYEPRWFMKDHHMNPDEAVRGFKDCGAAYAIGHHWGTFRLTAEGIEAPVEALEAALAAHGVAPGRFRALRPGEVWDVPEMLTSAARRC